MALVKKKIEGLWMFLDPKDGGISRTLVTKGKREEAFMYLLRTEAHGVGLDCGANIGYCTLSLAKNCDRVIAYEPDKRSYKLLEMSVEGISNVTISRSALSDHVGFIGFKNDKRPNLSRPSPKGGKLVDCVTIDSLNEQFNFIKADVEGGEVALLNGARNTLANAEDVKILLEVHPQYYNASNNFRAVLEWLVEIDYKFKYVISAKGKDRVVEEEYAPHITFPKYERKIYKDVAPEHAIPWACIMPADKKKVLRAIMLERK